MLNPNIFLVACEAKDIPCLEPLAFALRERGERVELIEFFTDLSENGGSALHAFVEAPFPVAVISSAMALELLTLLRPINSFLCVSVEHGIAPFKSYTYGRHLLSAHYYLAPTLGWAKRLVSLYPEQRSKVRLGGYPRIDPFREAIRNPTAPAEQGGRMLVILSWDVSEASLRSLPDLPFIDYLLHPADRLHVSSGCMEYSQVIFSTPDVTYDLIANASVVVGDFSSLTLECLHLGRDVVFIIDPELYNGSCDLDADFFDRSKASFGLVPSTSLRVTPDEAITASKFRELVERHGPDIALFKEAAPRASFPEEFLPPAGSNSARCAAELLSIIKQECQIPGPGPAPDRRGFLTTNHLRLITRTYESLLGRSPDLGGLITYLAILDDPGSSTIEATAAIGKALNHSSEAMRNSCNAASRGVVDELTAVLAREARLGVHKVAIILDALCDHLLPDVYRQQRDEATDNLGKIRWGIKVACTLDAGADDFILLAHACADQDQLDDALHWLKRALASHPEAGELHRFRASLLERKGRHEEALDAAKSAQAAGADENAIASDIARISGLLSQCSSHAPTLDEDAVDSVAEGDSSAQAEEVSRLDLRQFMVRSFPLLAVTRQRTSRSAAVER